MLTELAVALVLAPSGGVTDDVTVTGGRDGSLTVTERVTTGGPAVHRIPLRAPATAKQDRVYAIGNVHLTGGHAETGRDGVTATFTGGPATLSYTVDGAVDDTGRLRWSVTGGWDTGLNRVTATFTPPVPGMSTADCFAGAPGSARQCTFSEIGEHGVVRVEQDGLARGDRIDLAVQLPPGSLPANARFVPVSTIAAAFAFGPVPAVGLIVLALALLLGALAVAGLRRRDRATTRATRVTVVPPAYAAIVEDRLDLAGTALDLAARGHLHFTETDGADWLVTRGEGDELRDFERTVLMAFDGPRLSEARPLDPEALRTRLRADAVREGWLSRWPVRVRRLGFALLASGVLTTAVLTFTVGDALLGVWVIVAGLALIAAAPGLPRRTARGRTLTAPPRPGDEALAAALDGVLALSERRRALDGVFA
ncbi:DUF2207 domain-containing protein [Amycolatopsis sp. PS_44_ISF1]|uniref:DUF2207 domain-containing protein n=1 Tax=Amycolatopsis sp. PS_44_ISF1 TaxID=2974917 RepID=UPI0028DDECC4|nr:DUF2207 domain-containing protein [Amycolatopsis sp. PS_44_ISF1]MDT8909357.1 DUF2207 domain-containing protein [Amycolatopsis sp. PS_44_ISF1]